MQILAHYVLLISQKVISDPALAILLSFLKRLRTVTHIKPFGDLLVIVVILELLPAFFQLVILLN
jgi:hypothetical protein